MHRIVDVSTATPMPSLRIGCGAGESKMAISTNTLWPELPYEAWRETCSTLQLWMQIVGKIRLAQTPWLNHSWHVPLYVTAKGLTTSPVTHGPRSFEIQFDFPDHVFD